MRSSAILAIAAYVAIPAFVAATPMPADGSPPIISDGAPFSRKYALNVSHSSIESNSNKSPRPSANSGGNSGSSQPQVTTTEYGLDARELEDDEFCGGTFASSMDFDALDRCERDSIYTKQVAMRVALRNMRRS
ncbi:hypothetical protein BKA93DRAFT_753067 [Sparassis latifolia]